ncbi:hypothetical protein D3C74_344780 [compost metagenome]
MLRRFVEAECPPLSRHVHQVFRHGDHASQRLGELIRGSNRLTRFCSRDIDMKIDHRAHHFTVRQPGCKRGLQVLVARLVRQSDLEANVLGFQVVHGQYISESWNQGGQIYRYLIAAV